MAGIPFYPSIEITGVSGFPTKGVLPNFDTFTGTITSNGKNLIGVGTLFEKEISGSGLWIYSDALNEVREVSSVFDNKLLILKVPFSSNIGTPESLKVVKPQDTSFIIANIGSATAKVQGRDLGAGKAYNTSHSPEYAPITYDALTSTLQVSVDRGDSSMTNVNSGGGGGGGGDASAANQLITNALLDDIKTALKDFEESTWKDANGVTYIRRVTLDESTNTYVVSFTLPNGVPHVPVLPAEPNSDERVTINNGANNMAVNADGSINANILGQSGRVALLLSTTQNATPISVPNSERYKYLLIQIQLNSGTTSAGNFGLKRDVTSFTGSLPRAVIGLDVTPSSFFNLPITFVSGGLTETITNTSAGVFTYILVPNLLGENLFLNRNAGTSVNINVYGLDVDLVGLTVMANANATNYGNARSGLRAVNTDVVGTNWVTLPSDTARNVIFKNLTGTDIVYRETGFLVEHPLPNNTYFTVTSLNNANEWQIKRADNSNTVVNLTYQIEN